MPTLNEIKIKYAHAVKQRDLSCETRDKMQALADAEEDLTVKDILITAAIQMTTNIAEMDAELLEVAEMIATVERRMNKLHHPK